MNDKEFEEFFKSLDNSENSDSEKKNSADDEFVFSDFFEDSAKLAKPHNSASRAICAGRRHPHLLSCKLRCRRLSNHSICTIISPRWI